LARSSTGENAQRSAFILFAGLGIQNTAERASLLGFSVFWVNLISQGESVFWGEAIYSIDTLPFLGPGILGPPVVRLRVWLPSDWHNSFCNFDCPCITKCAGLDRFSFGCGYTCASNLRQRQTCANLTLRVGVTF